MNSYNYDSSSDYGYAEVSFINGILDFYSSNYSFGNSESINLSEEETYKLFLAMKEFYNE